MPESRDLSIKLFGRKIPLTEDSSHMSDSESLLVDSTQVMDKCRKATKTEMKEPTIGKSCKEMTLTYKDEVQESSDQCLTQENGAKANHKTEEDQGDASDTGNTKKIIKKPDKVLPCPRCDSLETKFCYFNNYNVNQPRHFCKNCQRYWTAGGTMRNVPVGAGRRKNKPVSLQYCQLDGTPFTQAGILESARHQRLSCVGLPLSVRPGTDTPRCESVATLLDPKDQKTSAEMHSVAFRHDGEEPTSSGSSLTSTSFLENKLPEAETEPRNCDNFTPTPPSQFYPGPPWTYPWNPMVFGPVGSNPIAVCTGSQPMMPVPGFCTIPFAAGAYWGSMASWDARSCNVPLSRTTGSLSSSSCSRSSSPLLGKHLRDTCSLVEEETEQCLWIPKTLRIDDLGAAAKSSILDTLKTKPQKNEPIIKGGIFKAFQPKSETSSDTSDSDKIVQANPAALSRSQMFQESG